MGIWGKRNYQCFPQVTLYSPKLNSNRQRDYNHILVQQQVTNIPFLVTRNCLSAGRYDFRLLGSPPSLRAHDPPTHQPDQIIRQSSPADHQREEGGRRGRRQGAYQDQVGHLATRLSPARMNSGKERTPFSRNADTVRGPVTRSTVPL
jgi:hypothetical protein